MCRDLPNCIYVRDFSIEVAMPVERPIEFEGYFTEFVESAVAANDGYLDAISPRIETRDERQLNKWFSDHAQFSYKSRSGGVKHQGKRNAAKDEKRLGAAMIRDVNRRDNYRCRYCGYTVLPVEFFKKLSIIVGSGLFQFKGKNSEIHGIRLVYGSTADHVEPWADGGRTSLENLVTACWPCNFGKYNYSLAELGMSDPRDRAIASLDSRVHFLFESFGLPRLID